MAGRAYFGIVSIGNTDIYQVTGVPVFTARLGSLAIRSDVAELYQNTDGATAWSLIGGGGTTGVSRLPFAVTTNTDALGLAAIYACTDTTAERTLTISTATIALGTPSSVLKLTINDESGGAGTNNITIDTEGAETIDGASSVAIVVGSGVIRLYSDGSNLYSE